MLLAPTWFQACKNKNKFTYYRANANHVDVVISQREKHSVHISIWKIVDYTMHHVHNDSLEANDMHPEQSHFDNLFELQSTFWYIMHATI